VTTSTLSGQQLAHQLATRGAERNRTAISRCRRECPRDQQVRDVRARDQQHEADHRHQHDQRGREIVAQRRVADVAFSSFNCPS
jgi:hypothetical protein